MNITPDFAGLIGNTPLLRLRRLSDETGCQILGKCEFLNPGGSVKDRAALGIEGAQGAKRVRRPPRRRRAGCFVGVCAGAQGVDKT